MAIHQDGTTFMGKHHRTSFERHSTFISGAIPDFFTPHVKLTKKNPTHSDSKFLNYLKSQGKKEIIKPTKSALEV